MANYNNPNGAEVMTQGARIGLYDAGATALQERDFVVLSSGKLVIFDPSSHNLPMGVMAQDAAANETGVKVYDDLSNVTMRIQVKTGTYAKASHDGSAYSLAGGTGVQGVDLTATVPHVRVLRHSPVQGAEDVGTYARIECELVSPAYRGLIGHMDGTASKHDASEIDFELADGSKAVVQASSDTVEAALIDLDDIVGTLTNDTDGYTAVADLTDSSGGTADGTVAAVSGSGADSDINNNFAEMGAKVNAILAVLRSAGILAAS